MSDLIDRQAAIDDIWTVSQLAPLDREWIDRWLRQLPPANTSETPNSSDTISRQAAIDALYHVDEYNGRSVEAIRKLPPAQPEQPEPKRGEWLERDVIDEPKGKHITQWQSARCSVCGRYHTTPYLYSFTHYNFCPNCGADMREVTE